MSEKKPDNRVYLRVSQYEKKIFTRAKSELKISARKVIEQVYSKPCGASEIILYNKYKTKSIIIPSGKFLNK